MEIYRKSYFESHLGGLERLMQFLSQINKKIADQFHFQWHRRRLNYQFSNYVTDKVNGSRVQPSLFGEDQDRTRETAEIEPTLDGVPFSWRDWL